MTTDGRPRAWALIALCTCPLPPFVAMYLAQRLGEQWFGALSLWTSLAVILGIAAGIVITLILILSSGVVADIKAHEVWLALRSRLMGNPTDGDDRPSW